MSEETKNRFASVGNSLLHWRLVIWKGFNGCLIVALGAIVAGLSNLRWEEMDAQSKFLFVCGVGLTVLKSLDMLLDQTISRVKEREPNEK